MRIEALESLIAVHETKSISRASERVYLTQPAVTAHIKNLEAYFQATLLDRGGQGVTLTPTGHLVLEYARQVVALTNRVREKIDEEKPLAGDIFVAGGTTAGNYILPYLTGLAKLKYPDLRINIHVLDSETIIDRMLAGELDIGIIAYPSPRRDIQSVLFLDYKLCLISPPQWVPECDHPEIGEFVQYPLLTHEEGTYSRTFIERKLEECGCPISNWSRVIPVANAGVIKTLVEAHLGVGFISQWAMGSSASSGQIKVVWPNGFNADRRYYLSRVARKEHSHQAKKFWELLLTPGIDETLRLLMVNGFGPTSAAILK
ncbi:MAG: LysR substrate-binding domain-containing protein [Bacillota bacterium]